MRRLLASPLRAYRIADTRYPLLSGFGAAQWGARWNSPGREVIYCAATYEGALLERLAHTNIGAVPRTQGWIEITLPTDLEVEEPEPDAIAGWDTTEDAGRAYGDGWFDERRTVALIVPSIVARPHGRNILLNPHHPDFRRVMSTEPQPVVWDSRLFQKPPSS